MKFYSRLFRHFRFQFLLRLFWLQLLMGAGFYFYLFPKFYFTAVIIWMAGLIHVLLLIHWLEKSNQQFLRFLDAIRFRDFTQSFKLKLRGKPFNEMDIAFKDVMSIFQTIQQDKESQYHYLQHIVENLKIGILVFGDEKDPAVILHNQTAKFLLRTPSMRKLSDVQKKNPDFVQTIRGLRSEDKTLFNMLNPETREVESISIYANQFRMRDQIVTLISLQNIRSELESKEMEAWQNLIRVLTHEIMNSITPIASLSGTTRSILSKIENVESSSFEDALKAVQTIESRSQGLIQFVQSYRELTRIPKPEKSKFEVNTLFEKIRPLVETEAGSKSIKIGWEVRPERLTLTADASLIEQVVINLVKNAIDAFPSGCENSEVHIAGTQNPMGQIFIRVTDNGPGIHPEALEQIFIPFFTTKQEGSGIGLSLSRQIMRLHDGSIHVQSKPGEETVFTLRF